MNSVVKVCEFYHNKELLNQIQVSLYQSSPQAGFPSPGDDMVEMSLNVHELLVKHPDSTFFVRVEGDSMEGAGIFSGDILVIDRSIEAKTGTIVVAAVDGGLVVKRLKINPTGSWLCSEQEGYEPIKLNDGSDCYLWGVVTGSVRQF